MCCFTGIPADVWTAGKLPENPADPYSTIEIFFADPEYTVQIGSQLNFSLTTPTQNYPCRGGQPAEKRPARHGHLPRLQYDGSKLSHQGIPRPKLSPS